jgi:hypothetical protein
LQRLKGLPWEDVEFLLLQREKLSAAKLIAQIAGRYGVAISEQRLSDFWRWAESQAALLAMNADAEQFRAEFAKANPEATLEEAHEATLAYLHLKAAREDDTKLAKFVLIELRKAREGSREDRKLRLLEAKAAQAKEVLSDTKLTPEEQAAKMREVFGL